MMRVLSNPFLERPTDAAREPLRPVHLGGKEDEKLKGAQVVGQAQFPQDGAHKMGRFSQRGGVFSKVFQSTQNESRVGSWCRNVEQRVFRSLETRSRPWTKPIVCVAIATASIGAIALVAYGMGGFSFESPSSPPPPATPSAPSQPSQQAQPPSVSTSPPSNPINVNAPDAELNDGPSIQTVERFLAGAPLVKITGDSFNAHLTSSRPDLLEDVKRAAAVYMTPIVEFAFICLVLYAIKNILEARQAGQAAALVQARAKQRLLEMDNRGLTADPSRQGGPSPLDLVPGPGGRRFSLFDAE